MRVEMGDGRPIASTSGTSKLVAIDTPPIPKFVGSTAAPRPKVGARSFPADVPGSWPDDQAAAAVRLLPPRVNGRRRRRPNARRPVPRRLLAISAGPALRAAREAESGRPG